MSSDKFVQVRHDHGEQVNWADVQSSDDSENDEQVWSTVDKGEAIDISKVEKGYDDGIVADPEPVRETRPSYQSRGGYGERERQTTEDRLNAIGPNGPFVAFIGNLFPTTTEEELGSYFGELGVKQIRIINNSNKPAIFAYIDFETLDGLKNALMANGSSIQDGRNLKVDVAHDNTRRDRSRGGGNYRSRYDNSWGGGGGRDRDERPRYNDRDRNERPRYNDRDRNERPPSYFEGRNTPRDQPLTESQERRERENPFGSATANEKHTQIYNKPRKPQNEPRKQNPDRYQQNRERGNDSRERNNYRSNDTGSWRNNNSNSNNRGRRNFGNNNRGRGRGGYNNNRRKNKPSRNNNEWTTRGGFSARGSTRTRPQQEQRPQTTASKEKQQANPFAALAQE